MTLILLYFTHLLIDSILPRQWEAPLTSVPKTSSDLWLSVIQQKPPTIFWLYCILLHVYRKKLELIVLGDVMRLMLHSDTYLYMNIIICRGKQGGSDWGKQCCSGVMQDPPPFYICYTATCTPERGRTYLAMLLLTEAEP